MKRLLFKLFLSAAAVYLVSLITDIGVPVSPVAEGFYRAVIVALVLGVINVTIKPIINFIAVPINSFTLGAFSFIINAAMIYLASFLLPWFSIPTVLGALIFSVLLSVVNWMLHKFD